MSFKEFLFPEIASQTLLRVEPSTARIYIVNQGLVMRRMKAALVINTIIFQIKYIINSYLAYLVKEVFILKFKFPTPHSHIQCL